jgi:hypothetical protein
MECPYCGAELKHVDTYFQGRPGGYVNGHLPHPIGYYSEPTSNYKVLGDIFECPNRDGFEYLEDAQAYKENPNCQNQDTPDEDVVCDSAAFKGHFYTDTRGELHEGYPC